MATGFYDANGIWNYGEDDNIALFSDTLNKLADSTSDAFTSDRSRLSTLEAGSLSGLIPLNPMTVAVAGGTASKNSLGVVTFTTATSISLNSVFSSGYRSYRIIVPSVTMGTFGQTVSMRFRNAGTDNSSAIYFWNGFQQTGTGAVTTWNAANAVNFNLSINAIDGSIVIDIHNPATAFRKTGTYQAQGWSAATQGYSAGIFADTTSTFDGFTLFPSSGNFSGIIQVFGYND